MIFNSKLVDRVRTQLEGLKSNADVAKGAPFNQQALQKLLDDVTGVSARQEQAKAELHKATQELVELCEIDAASRRRMRTGTGSRFGSSAISRAETRWKGASGGGVTREGRHCRYQTRAVQLDQKSRVLRDAFTRNVAFAQSHFGKFDKKLEEFGGRIAGTGKRGSKKNGAATAK